MASAVVVTCALACPGIATALGVGGGAGAAGTGVTTVTSVCSVDEPACASGADALTKDLVDLGSTSATTEDVQLSSHFTQGNHLWDIGKAIIGNGEDTQGAKSLIANTLQTGEINAAKSSWSYLAYEQLYGNPETGDPVMLRVVWDLINQEVRTAYPFGVPLT